MSLLLNTNDLVSPSDYYLIQLRFKELVIDSIELQLDKSSTRPVELSLRKSGSLNGLMTVNLYKISSSYYRSWNSTNSSTAYSEETVAGWLENRGEISFMRRPSEGLEVLIVTEKQTYAPGD